MAAVNPLPLRERAWGTISDLKETDDRLNDTIERMEDMFEMELPEGSYGCLLLSHNRDTWTHLLYYDAILWIETWSRRYGFHCEDAINHDIRANKIETIRRIKDMWVLCGGNPERIGRKYDDPIGTG